MLEKELIPECIWFHSAEEQRKQEEGTEGTMNFQKTGCYSCNGYDDLCDGYESRSNDKANSEVEDENL
jgi:hypothetical protein